MLWWGFLNAMWVGDQPWLISEYPAGLKKNYRILVHKSACMLDSLKFSSGLIILALLVYTGCSEPGRSDESGILVSTSWLQEKLNDPDLVILHAGTAELYDSIHVPGARLIIPSRFTVSSDTLRNEIPAADSLVEYLRQVGVDNDSRILLYHEDESLLTRTARVFLTLDYLGLGDRTFVLNGGLPSWQEEERTLTDLVPEIEPGNLENGTVREVIMESSELDRLRWSDEVVLIDTRTPDEYEGDLASPDEAPEGGHIEGAYFLPYQDLLMDDKAYLFRPASELEELFRKAGMDPDRTTVVYCGSGIRASASYLAARHLGYPVLLYDGSFEEWRDLGLPLTSPVLLLKENE